MSAVWSGTEMKGLFVRMLNLLRTQVRGPEMVSHAESAPDTVPPVRMPAVSAGTAQRQTRGASPTVLKAMELLSRNPDITASEAAAALNLSLSYARTVLRRARAADQPGSVRSAEPDTPLLDLQRRLAAAERDLAAVRSMPSHVRASLNLNRRAEVLRLLGGGMAPESIAERLAIPQGEVEFIRKVDRLVVSSA